MTNYSRGAHLERRVVKHFLSAGARWAQRTPGSKSPVDVVALFDKTVVLCQCQISEYFPPGKIEALKEITRYCLYSVAWLAWRGKDNKLCFRVISEEDSNG